MRTYTPAIGDVFEISTPIGLAYIQLSHMTEEHLPLIRVLPGVYSSRQSEIGRIVQERELYFTFYVLPYAIKAGKAVLVGHVAIPDWARGFPLMRRRWAEGRSGKFSWLIGSAAAGGTPSELREMTHVTELSDQQKRLSIDQVCSHEALVNKIVRGWTPERDEELNEIDWSTRSTTDTDATTLPCVNHYFYFTKRSNAREAGTRLRAKGWRIHLKVSPDGRTWRLIAEQRAARSNARTCSELTALADELHGEYDGWSTFLN